MQSAIRAAKEEGFGGIGAQGGDDREAAGGVAPASRVRIVQHRFIRVLRQTIGRPSLLKLRWHWSCPRWKRGTHFGRMKATVGFRFRFFARATQFVYFFVSGGSDDNDGSLSSEIPGRTDFDAFYKSLQVESGTPNIDGGTVERRSKLRRRRRLLFKNPKE